MRTRATLRRAEFGFFGVVVYTRVQTPRRCGAATLRLRPFPDFRPGVASFFLGGLRPIRTSWEVVGMRRRMLPEEPRAAAQAAAASAPRRAPSVGISAAAITIATIARLCATMPKAPPGIGSPKTRMPPAIEETLAVAVVIAITGTASPSWKDFASA